jgi:PhnB protein
MTININVPRPGDVDAAIAKAKSAGAEVLSSPQDTFWGARYGQVRDPFGHIWAFNAPLQEPSP